MSKPLSILLLVIAAGLTLWRGSEAIIHLWKYWRLNTEVLAKIENCQVKEISSSKFALVVRYTYRFQNRERKGEGQVPPPFFPNQFAALDAMKTMPVGERSIWLDSSNPSYTALEKSVPWRSILYTLSSLAILFYFIQLSSAGVEKAFDRD
jgi:hypothetical protein